MVDIEIGLKFNTVILAELSSSLYVEFLVKQNLVVFFC